MEQHEEKILYEKREIFLWNDFDSQLAFDIVQKIRFLSDSRQSPIYIFIHSDGGDMDSLASIMDEISYAQKTCEIYLIVHGKAYSAAAFLLAVAKPGYAFATPNSAIMLHPCLYDLPQDYKDIQTAYTTFANSIFDRYLAMVAKRTGKRAKTVEKDIKSGLWLSAKDAIKYGIIDGIWE